MCRYCVLDGKTQRSCLIVVFMLMNALEVCGLCTENVKRMKNDREKS